MKPANWLDLVQAPRTEGELEALRRSVVHGQPFGSDAWTERGTRQLGLGHTLRRRSQPKKAEGPPP